MKIECSNVGDRYVLEMMLKKGYILGGEQSGHVIFLEYASTGDGELTALQFMSYPQGERQEVLGDRS